jgi:hypothetical protein
VGLDVEDRSQCQPESRYVAPSRAFKQHVEPGSRGPLPDSPGHTHGASSTDCGPPG